MDEVTVMAQTVVPAVSAVVVVLVGLGVLFLRVVPVMQKGQQDQRTDFQVALAAQREGFFEALRVNSERNAAAFAAERDVHTRAVTEQCRRHGALLTEGLQRQELAQQVVVGATRENTEAIKELTGEVRKQNGQTGEGHEA